MVGAIRGGHGESLSGDAGSGTKQQSTLLVGIEHLVGAEKWRQFVAQRAAPAPGFLGVVASKNHDVVGNLHRDVTRSARTEGCPLRGGG